MSFWGVEREQEHMKTKKMNVKWNKNIYIE